MLSSPHNSGDPFGLRTRRFGIPTENAENGFFIFGHVPGDWFWRNEANHADESALGFDWTHVHTNDQLVEQVRRRKEKEGCIDMLIVAGHGGNGGAHLGGGVEGDGLFRHNELSREQAQAISESICEGGTLYLGACHNIRGLNARPNVQKLADLLGVEICFCPGFYYPDGCEAAWDCVAPHPELPEPEFDTNGDLIQPVDLYDYSNGREFIRHLDQEDYGTP